MPYAISLARTFGSGVTLLHVMRVHDEPGGAPSHDALRWEISRQEARGYLARIEGELSRALEEPVDVRLEQGHPAERIVDVAREIGADLTVLGSHGEAGVTPWNLGSTVQQVLAVTRSSMLIVHSSSAGPPKVTLKRILVPLDGSVRTESVLPAVVRMASTHGAEILLVHVVHDPPLTNFLYTAEDMDLARNLAARQEAGAKRYLDRLKQRLTHEGASVHTLVSRHANERQCLLEISRTNEPDLIVLSAHGSACDSVRPFGSVTTYLLTHSMVPLLVLQDLPETEVQRTPNGDERRTSPPMRASYPPESV